MAYPTVCPHLFEALTTGKSLASCHWLDITSRSHVISTVARDMKCTVQEVGHVVWTAICSEPLDVFLTCDMYAISPSQDSQDCLYPNCRVQNTYVHGSRLCSPTSWRQAVKGYLPASLIQPAKQHCLPPLYMRNCTSIIDKGRIFSSLTDKWSLRIFPLNVR